LKRQPSGSESFGMIMYTVELYREHARICLSRASLEGDDGKRTRLAVQACSWRTLAQQADRAVDADGERNDVAATKGPAMREKRLRD
jgi:hypothetical protein